MKADWTYHLKDPEEKERFKKYVYGNKTILERLMQIADQWEEETTSSELSQKAYDSPNWDYRQADTNGYLRCLRDFKQLLTLDQKEV